MEETLQQNSNRVNARFFDHNGSLYIVFYNGGFADRTAFFEAGLNQGNLPNTLEIMTIASRMTPPNNSSLLLKWLRAQDDPWQEREFSIGTPGETSRNASPNLSDSSQMDVDS